MAKKLVRSIVCLALAMVMVGGLLAVDTQSKAMAKELLYVCQNCYLDVYINGKCSNCGYEQQDDKELADLEPSLSNLGETNSILEGLGYDPTRQAIVHKLGSTESE